mmetsp:Transcript_5148/g.5923  ORF Transcript_5148/g.5923 Transcript_5148/m.5923 type:complete len:114 (-) Transcript_5148:717-1058(-)
MTILIRITIRCDKNKHTHYFLLEKHERITDPVKNSLSRCSFFLVLSRPRLAHSLDVLVFSFFPFFVQDGPTTTTTQQQQRISKAVYTQKLIENNTDHENDQHNHVPFPDIILI